MIQGKNTGFRDFKKQEIKEGDILQSYHFGGGKQGRKIYYLYHFVVWNTKWNMWFLASSKWDDNKQGGEGCCPMSYYTDNDRIKSLKVKVVGNVYENPTFIQDEHNKVVEENKKYFTGTVVLTGGNTIED